jgi:Protein of unknown function (DUF3630)
MNVERTDTGLLEIRLSDDPDQFDNLAEIVRSQLDGTWTAQINGLDQSYWDLDVSGHKITVHREHYLGVSVSSSDEPAKWLLLERLQHLSADPATK